LPNIKERNSKYTDHARHPQHPDNIMSSISEFLSDDHNACDDLFAAAENAVAVKDWSQARSKFDIFNSGMRRHFAREEDVLFPAFEARTGMSGGPIFIMRGEHQQMNGLLAEMNAALN